MAFNVQWIANWVASKPVASLVKAPQFSGGFEHWAQMDMALFWIAGNVDADVESPVYANAALSADLFLNTPVGVGPHFDLIELKAWQYNVEFLDAFFSNKIAVDIVKVQGVLNAHYANQPVTRYAIGLVSCAGVNKQYNLQPGPAWTPQECMAYVDHHYPAVAVNGQVVDLHHTLAPNGDGSIIISST